MPMDYGGEEFCVLLPNTDLSGAVQVAETIRSAVLATGQLQATSPVGTLSVSIGVAAFDGMSCPVPPLSSWFIGPSSRSTRQSPPAAIQ